MVVDNSGPVLAAVWRQVLVYWHVAWTGYLRPYWWVWVPIVLILVGLRLQSVFRPGR